MSIIIFCPLIESELCRAVNAHPTSQEDQETMNEAIWELNAQVFKINSERGTF